MSGGTLPIWGSILVIGIVAFAILGRLNAYVTREQVRELIAHRDTKDYARFYTVNIKFRTSHRTMFIVMTSIIIIIAVLFLIIDFDKTYKSVLGDNAFGLAIGLFILLLAAFFSFVIWAACFCIMEENSIDYLQEYFARHYGIQHFNIEEW